MSQVSSVRCSARHWPWPEHIVTWGSNSPLASTHFAWAEAESLRLTGMNRAAWNA